jgi:hypothetical protein
LAQQVSKPPEQSELQPDIAQPQRKRFSKAGIYILLVLIGLLIVSSASLFLVSLAQGLTHPLASTATLTPTQQLSRAQTVAPTATTNQNATPTSTPPIFTPGNTVIPPLQLPGGRYLVYERQNELYWVSSTGGQPQMITAPGYLYNQAVRPLLTSSGQLLYTGDGIWLTDIFGGTPQQIATLDPNKVITSMALSSDGTAIAWSTEPAGGHGLIDIYAGPLTAPTRVFEQASSACPCFRVFAFMNGQGKQGDTTLLLTDGQQSHEAIQFGLWTLNIANPASARPHLVMDEENSQQGPLALAPQSNILLYSSYEGEVPMPSDNSVPDDVATLTYPNSLDITTVDGQALATSQVLLSEQHELSNRAVYHWETTPVFTPDGHTLLYVEFSSQTQAPYDRSSALFEVQVSGSGKNLHVSKPQLMAGSTARLLELGPWLNNHILTFYGDGTLYALDIQSGAVATIAPTKTYARIIAVVGLRRPDS